MGRVGETRVKGFNRRERRKAFNRKERKDGIAKNAKKDSHHRGTEKIGDCRSVENAFQCGWLDGETKGPSTVLGCRLAPLRMTGLKNRKGTKKNISPQGTQRTQGRPAGVSKFLLDFARRKFGLREGEDGIAKKDYGQKGLSVAGAVSFFCDCNVHGLGERTKNGGCTDRFGEDDLLAMRGSVRQQI